MFHDNGLPVVNTGKHLEFRSTPRFEPQINTRTELHPAPWVYRREGHYRIKMKFRVPSTRFNTINQGHIAIMQLWSGPEGSQRVLAGVAITPGMTCEVFINGEPDLPDLTVDRYPLTIGRWLSLDLRFGLHRQEQYFQTERRTSRLSGQNLIPSVDGYGFFRPKFGIYAPSTGAPLGVDFKRFLFRGEHRGVTRYDDTL